MNKITLTGRTTRDPEIIYSNGESGQNMIARFNFAVNRMFTRNEKNADFFNCAAFGKQAKTIEKYVRKGTHLLLAGRMENNNYEKDGVKVYGYQLVVETIEFLDKKPNEAGAVTEDEDGYMQITEEMEKEMPFQ